MIAKKVYYCWFGKPMPADIQKRIATWKKSLPAYEFCEINEQNFDYNAYQFTKDAYQAGKFAYVSDVARLVFLEKTGGIYLDTDVDVLQPFDAFLREEVLHLSIEYYGYEITGVNVGTIIAPANHPVIKTVKEKILASTYNNARPPINVYFNQVLTGLVYKDKEQYLESQMTKVHQASVFCKQSKNSVTVHRYDNSWGESLSAFQKSKRLCGVLLKKLIGRNNFAKIHNKEKMNEDNNA